MFKYVFLIIGYGSIGKNHANILSKMYGNKSVNILTKKNVKTFQTIKNLSETKKIKFDYVIISSPPSIHLKQLKYFEKNFKNKKILVEKPLFNKSSNFKIKKNQVFVGYNLRFHPIVNYLKTKINKKKIFSITVNCSSFLPQWRHDIDYKKTYSSKKILGGGALLDLSHEFDYFQYIFGQLKINNINYIKTNKISPLKINVEDNFLIVGRLKKMNFLINVNFFSKHIKREIIIERSNDTIKANLINNVIEIFSKKNNHVKKLKLKKVNTYKEQHIMLSSKFAIKKGCSYDEGLNLLYLIEKIKKKCF